MAANQIITDELDFDQVKLNIKEFLKSQDVFSDYNYEGSALSVLIDVLAYNTLYNNFYNHLSINEMFMDSASKYASVVSLAKPLGYTPRSTKSSRARLTVTVSGVPLNPTVLTLPTGTHFRATVGNADYSFYTLTSYTAINNSGKFVFEDIEVVEGLKLETQYVYSNGAQCIIPNDNVDTTTLNVTVQENISSSIYKKYQKVTDILKVKTDDLVYYLKQREDTKYEVYFGNGVLGKKLSTGNVVHLDYIVSSGADSNGARQFVYSSGFRSDVFIQIQTLQVAMGGSPPEDVEEIKFNAPRIHVAQNRAVNSDDYSVLLKSQFPSIESLSIWGGQNNVPVAYGKVFIAPKPKDREFFLQEEKEQMVSYLIKDKNVMTLIPEIVDPEYIRIQLETSVYYNATVSRKSVGQLESLVRNTISNYAGNLTSFGSSFRFSQLTNLIDETDVSIISNITTLKLRKTIDPIYNIVAKYIVRFENPIYQDLDTGGTIWSTRFFIGPESDRVYVKDDGAGNIQMYLENNLGEPRFYKTVGKVNYNTGQIELIDILIRGLYDQEIELMVTPLSNDVIPIRQYLISIPKELIKVNIISDSEKSSGIKQKHKFAPSR